MRRESKYSVGRTCFHPPDIFRLINCACLEKLLVLMMPGQRDEKVWSRRLSLFSVMIIGIIIETLPKALVVSNE